jgi:hypothetical protein
MSSIIRCRASSDVERDGQPASVVEDEMRAWLITIGLVLVAVGLLWPWLAKLGLGRLPGDIVVERGSFGFYFPIVTCLVVSVVVSLIFWLLNR